MSRGIYPGSHRFERRGPDPEVMTPPPAFLFGSPERFYEHSRVTEPGTSHAGLYRKDRAGSAVGGYRRILGRTKWEEDVLVLSRAARQLADIGATANRAYRLRCSHHKPLRLRCVWSGAGGGSGSGRQRPRSAAAVGCYSRSSRVPRSSWVPRKRS